jgi:hypothetical protein
LDKFDHRGVDVAAAAEAVEQLEALGQRRAPDRGEAPEVVAGAETHGQWEAFGHKADAAGSSLYVAAAGGRHACDDSQQGALAGAVAPRHVHEVTGGEGHAHLSQHEGLAAAVTLADVGQSQR